LLHRAKQHGAAIAIVNARISDRSLPRYRGFRWFFRRVLADIDLFLAQTEEDARRLQAIGALPERVQVSGNLKFDVRTSSRATLAEDLSRARGDCGKIIVCGSTTEGEEELLLDAFHQVLHHFPSAIMILAPRHPQRFDCVAGLVAASGVPLMRRSVWTGSEQVSGAVFLLDSVGELAALYALADVAFVGGSLLPGIGGHNILEPAHFGVAILIGPNTYNFREIVRVFERGGAVTTVNPGNLSGVLLQLLQEDGERQRLGQRARELFLKNTGATGRTLAALEPLLREHTIQVP
jgi:3-deoxy-D-manno-octulosonic-acid transferase